MSLPVRSEHPVRLFLGKEGFARLFPVSRETLDRLGVYVDLLEAWNRRINLVGRDTIGDVWRRHILDAAQLLPQIPPATRGLVDLGSGAGLPGLVLGILGVPGLHLVESDLRKAAFLREALRLTGTPGTLHAQRADRVPPFRADVVTARALAPLPELLVLAEPFLGKDSRGLFLKGKAVEDELAQALAQGWSFGATRVPSLSDSSGTLLKLETIARVSGHRPG